MVLNNFVKTTKDRKRYARGVSSGCGRTSGRGHKGYKARSGSSVRGFEGGQTPIYRRLPMRGFNSKNKKDICVVSLKKIISFNENEVIDKELLVKMNVLKDLLQDVKLIGSDINAKDLNKIKTIKVDFASSSVIDRLKKNNISVVLNNN